MRRAMDRLIAVIAVELNDPVAERYDIRCEESTYIDFKDLEWPIANEEVLCMQILMLCREQKGDGR